MNELIKIEKSNVGGDLIETVNARELHGFLEVGRDFSTWIKRRIEQYGFEEGVDFCSFLSESTGNRSSKGCAFDSPFRGNQTSGRGGDRRSIEYHISIGMAKELAMVENNDQGRKVRRYFIECEKRLKQVVNNPLPLLSPKEEDFRVLEFIANSLRLPDSGKLGMYEKYCKHQAPQLLPALPSYAVDSPTGSTAGSSEPTVPISNVVEGIMSAAKANKALDKAGLLEQRFRKSSNGEKAFWSVTEKGLNYGKNITSPHNQRETQPHWYVSKKEDLVNIIKNNMQ